MKKALLFSAFTAAVFLFSSLRKPTGPAYAHYLIKPIGYSDDGVVLCTTDSYFNGSGAQVMMPETYGYLLVSAKGLWKETTYRTLSEEDGTDAITRFQEKFEAELNFKNPPAHLKEWVNVYHINHRVDTALHKKYSWSPKGIYDAQHRLVSSDIHQRIIGNIKVNYNAGTPVNCFFSVKDVLFFENQAEDVEHKGALFEMEDDYGVSVDYYRITGVCLLKPATSAKFKEVAESGVKNK